MAVVALPSPHHHCGEAQKTTSTRRWLPWTQWLGEMWSPMPVVLWHGLGDSAYSEYMNHAKEELETMYPGIYVHIIALKETETEDRSATLFGNVNEQLEAVHEQLRAIPELRHGFDAIGFSQGGQFLRGYVERFNTPAVRNLITFGSQHMGITDLPICGPDDKLCKTVHRALQSNVYSDLVQSTIVIAQYFRDTRSVEQFEQYKQHNTFLYDINNEGPLKNVQYKRNLASLNKFVMVRFNQDETVVPSESAWFRAYEDPDKHRWNQTTPVPLRESEIYLNDWLGLAQLDRRGALEFHTCDGIHMHISPECKAMTIAKYVGRPRTGEWLQVWTKHASHCPHFMVAGVFIGAILWGAWLFQRRVRRQDAAAIQVTEQMSMKY